MRIIDRLVQQAVTDHLEENLDGYIKEAFERYLPAVVEERMRHIVTKSPDRELSEVGFKWAWYFAITDLWPSVSKKDAMLWLDDYMPEEFGSSSCAWSYDTAKEMANSFVSEYGEFHP